MRVQLKQIHNSDDAKTLAVELMSRHQSPEEAQRALSYFQDQLSRAVDEESKRVWKQQADDLSAWLESDDYKNGNYAQGVDQLVLELVEWRAMISAFESVETKSNPFKEHVFLSQWLVGAAYAVFSLLGKLTRGGKGDNTLKTAWDRFSSFIEQDGACTAEELEAITKCMHEKDGQFTNRSSRAVLFRNKVIAHNEKSLGIAWSDVDADIRVLVRIWSLLVSWASFGLIAPFRTAEQAFSGLHHFFDAGEIAAMKVRRSEYLEQVKRWCQTYLHKEEIDPRRTAFATIAVTSRVVSRSESK